MKSNLNNATIISRAGKQPLPKGKIMRKDLEFIETITVEESPYHLYWIKNEFTVCYASGAICQNPDTFAQVQGECLAKKHFG